MDKVSEVLIQSFSSYSKRILKSKIKAAHCLDNKPTYATFDENNLQTKDLQNLEITKYPGYDSVACGNGKLDGKPHFFTGMVRLDDCCVLFS